MLSFVFSLFLLLKTGEWQLQKNEEGIQIFTRKYADKSFKQIRATMTLEASLSTMTAIIKDDKETIQWADRLKEYKNLKVINNTEWYCYAIAAIPWPFKNKDIITHNVLTQDSSKVVNIHIVSKPDYIPATSDNDRIKKSEGSWNFKPLGNGKVEVTYLFYTEPDGILPQWMVTPLVVGSIFKTMQGLKRMTTSAKFKTVQLPYIKEK
jgi:hypothetical protein